MMISVEWLDEVVAKMRALGITTLKTSEYEIVLGEPPVKAKPEEKPKTKEDLQREQKDRVNRTLFAASNLRPRI